MQLLHGPAFGTAFAAALLIGTHVLAAAPPGAGSKKAAEDAVAYQINPAHSGAISFAAGFTPPLREAWVQNLGGPISYPLIADGLVLVTVVNSGYNSGTQMYALNLATGAIVWDKLIPSDSSWSNAAYDHGQVFIVNGYGDLEASDAKSGKIEWTAQLPSSNSYSAPTAHNGLLFVGASGYPDTLYAINEATGATQWSASLNGYNEVSAAAVGNGAVFAYDGHAYGFSAATGNSLWSYAGCSQSGYLTPVYSLGRLYVRTSCGGVVLDAANGNATGYFSADPAPAFSQRKDALSLIGGTVYDYNVRSGNVVWKYSGVNGDGGLVTAPIVINGLVIEGASYGNLYVLDYATGNIESTMNVGSDIPQPNEQNNYNGYPLTGLAAGEGTLVVPAGNQISAYVPQTAR